MEADYFIRVTEFGETLRPVLNRIAEWGMAYALPLQRDEQIEAGA